MDGSFRGRRLGKQGIRTGARPENSNILAAFFLMFVSSVDRVLSKTGETHNKTARRVQYIWNMVKIINLWNRVIVNLEIICIRRWATSLVVHGTNEIASLASFWLYSIFEKKTIKRNDFE